MVINDITIVDFVFGQYVVISTFHKSDNCIIFNNIRVCKTISAYIAVMHTYVRYTRMLSRQWHERPLIDLQHYKLICVNCVPSCYNQRRSPVEERSLRVRVRSRDKTKDFQLVHVVKTLLSNAPHKRVFQCKNWLTDSQNNMTELDIIWLPAMWYFSETTL